MKSKLLLHLLAPRRPRRRTQEGGFALVLALFVALTVLLGWLALANRSNSSRLGAALQDENREARIAAESGVATVFSELNRPQNRMLLARGQNLTDWTQPVGDASPLINPCANLDVTNPANLVKPSALVRTLGSGATVPLDSRGGNDRLTRQFRIIDFRLKNGDRSTGNDYNPDKINLRTPPRTDKTRYLGYAELIVEGQVLRNGRVAATSRVSQEVQVVPKCCRRSFRGPGDESRENERDPRTGYLPGLYGDDNRYCSEDFPPLLVGTGNSASANSGGVYTPGSRPEVRNQDDPNVRPERILCYTEQGACAGQPSADDVPVVPSNRKVPTVPVLSEDGIPCDDEDLECIREGLEKAARNDFTARSIELLNFNDGARNNSPNNAYAKDYIRVNENDEVEICNKTYTPPNNDPNGYAADLPDPTGTRKQKLDTTPTLVNGSCEKLMNNGNSSRNVCARQNIGGFVSYHCRIRNIFVNDFAAGNDQQVRQNNTLFIDTSRAPIYLYINEDWAKTQTSGPRDPVNIQMQNNGVDTARFKPIFTVGGYNDGQIQHVYCGTPNDSVACTTPAPSAISTRAALVSACRRRFDTVNQRVIDECEERNRDNGVQAEIGDDGFARGLFLFMPKSNIVLNGDPTENDPGDAAQGKPQLAAAVWANKLTFSGRTTELYVPGRNAEFYGLETSFDDRYAPRFTFDYVARSITGSSLFNLQF